MPFPTEIQIALQIYDTNKGRWRKLFRWDHPAIRALRRLREVDQTNCFMLYRCFIENKPNDKQESYKVYKVVLDYLAQENYSSIPEILDQLHNNKLLSLSNLNKLQELNGDQCSQLALLFHQFNNRGLLIQANFDNIVEYLKKNTDDAFTNFINLVSSLKNLNQENLNCLLEKPLEDKSILVLKILAENHLLTPNNYDELCKEKNRFLLRAYLDVWHPLELHLPKLTTAENQLIFDKLISLTQEEDPDKKIENFLEKLTHKSPKPARRNTGDNNRFSTAPPQRSKSRSSLEDLLSFNERPGTL